MEKLRHFLLNLLFPIECLNCQTEGEYLCANCFHQLSFNDLAASKQATANLKIPALEKVFIAGNYEDKLLQKLIKKYKYHFMKPLGEILARFLITFWHFQNEVPADLLIIPLPLTAKRLRWRGFNQAEVIARYFSQHFSYELCLDLKRTGKQAAQADLDESDRLENIKNVFHWSGKNLEGKNILLIDDVITTGATINEAAKTLKQAGAGAIYGLVLAKG